MLPREAAHEAVDPRLKAEDDPVFGVSQERVSPGGWRFEKHTNNAGYLTGQ